MTQSILSDRVEIAKYGSAGRMPQHIYADGRTRNIVPLIVEELRSPHAAGKSRPSPTKPDASLRAYVAGRAGGCGLFAGLVSYCAIRVISPSSASGCRSATRAAARAFG